MKIVICKEVPLQSFSSLISFLLPQCCSSEGNGRGVLDLLCSHEMKPKITDKIAPRLSVHAQILLHGEILRCLIQQKEPANKRALEIFNNQFLFAASQVKIAERKLF